MALSQRDTFQEELRIVLEAEATTIDSAHAFLHRWYSQSSSDEDDPLQLTVLNEAAAFLADPRLRLAGWQFYRDLATNAGFKEHDGLKIRLTIALFEIIAQPPAIPADVRLLFSLLDSVETRWAVFVAYERFPRWFRKHIEEYGDGRITDEEYNAWLHEQGLVMTNRGLRFIRIGDIPS